MGVGAACGLCRARIAASYIRWLARQGEHHSAEFDGSHDGHRHMSGGDEPTSFRQVLLGPGFAGRG
jgi:hypothetical protein